MIARTRRHLRHHTRFYLSAAVGAIVWAIVPEPGGPLRVIMAGDAAFLFYLVLMWSLALRITPAQLRIRAGIEDEGMALILLLVLLALGIISVSLFTVLNQTPKPDALHLVLAVASVPLGWAMLHTSAAFHYANLYYHDDDPDPATRRDAGGLDFPDTKEPGAWEFLYQSFVVGMTAQVADINVQTTEMRKATMAHGVISFFFNTVVLALAVNLGVQGPS